MTLKRPKGKLPRKTIKMNKGKPLQAGSITSPPSAPSGGTHSVSDNGTATPSIGA